jgi:uncharacterized protein (DUF1800 family)
MTMDAVVRAQLRFGLGVTALGTSQPIGDVQQWLLAQMQQFEVAPEVIARQPTAARIAGMLADYAEIRADVRAKGQRVLAAPDPQDQPAADLAVRDSRREIRTVYADAVAARLQAAALSKTPFMERLVHFWSNHFAVSVEKLPVLGLAGNAEFEAIRPHILGNFASLLRAAVQHPAMLVYLDQVQSIGPQSPAGARIARNGRARGLNENLAREILELHTLGVRTVYDQNDVTELARALTGWTVSGLGRGAGQRLLGNTAPGGFVFAPSLHEPGIRNILGQRFDQAGVAQGEAMLRALATHPATARHIATKLARHFCADDPPTSLVSRLERRFIETRGDLPSLYRVLVAAPECWEPNTAKFTTPWEWLVAVLRLTATPPESLPPAIGVNALAQLGQSIWKPGSPAGYDDRAASWAAPDALLRRVELAERLAARATRSLDARNLAQASFGTGLSAATSTALAQAESPQQALALLLVSPEMLRR